MLSSQCWRIHPKIRMPTAIRQPTPPDRDDDTRVAKVGGCVTGYPCCRGAKRASGMRPNTIDDTAQATGKPLPTNCQLPQGGILTCRSYQHWRHARACRANWPRWLSPCYNGASDAAVRPVWEHALLPKPPSLHITRPSFPARGRERGEKRAAHLEPQPVIPHPASLETAHDCNGVYHTRGRVDVKTPTYCNSERGGDASSSLNAFSRGINPKGGVVCLDSEVATGHGAGSAYIWVHREGSRYWVGRTRSARVVSNPARHHHQDHRHHHQDHRHHHHRIEGYIVGGCNGTGRGGPGANAKRRGGRGCPMHWVHADAQTPYFRWGKKVLKACAFAGLMSRGLPELRVRGVQLNEFCLLHRQHGVVRPALGLSVHLNLEPHRIAQHRIASDCTASDCTASDCTAPISTPTIMPQHRRHEHINALTAMPQHRHHAEHANRSVQGWHGAERPGEVRRHGPAVTCACRGSDALNRCARVCTRLSL